VKDLAGSFEGPPDLSTNPRYLDEALSADARRGRKTIIDAGPLVALLNRRDAHHAWVRAEFGRRPAPFFTCEAVLSEAEHLVMRGNGDPLQVLELVRRGALTIGLAVEDEAERLAKLQRSYRDQPMSLADACLAARGESLASHRDDRGAPPARRDD
jgi:predicted nucleic acid-binding protein